MDLVLERLLQAEEGLNVGPSQIDAVRFNVDHAQTLLGNAVPTDQDLATAKKAIDDASTQVDALAKADPAFEQEL
jgi:hypothetical protein